MKRRCAALGLLICLLFSACAPPATVVPIKTTSFRQSEKPARGTLLVFLPGRGDTSRSFEKEGFLQVVRRELPEADLIGVEAHLGYYVDHTILTRLREDVIIPAKEQGYRDIWLVGVSLGGLGAILYDTTYPGELTGIVVFAPYLGEDTLLPEIRGAGGMAGWQPGVVDYSDTDRYIWSRVKAYADPNRCAGRVYLGFGNQDRFATSDGFFGTLLPAAQVFTAKGGHDWSTWKILAARMLKEAGTVGVGAKRGAK